MSELNKQAFPAAPNSWGDPVLGLTLRQHAAIAMRVPMSGDPELDAMIREARRLDAAEKVLQGIVSVLHEGIRPTDIKHLATDALNISSALLAACGPKESLRDMTEADFDAVHGFDAAPDGWIEWHGGARPVTEDTLVRVMLSDGEEDENRADEYRWEHYGSPGDIIAYRVVK